jgi:hypothetical protein
VSKTSSLGVNARKLTKKQVYTEGIKGFAEGKTRDGLEYLFHTRAQLGSFWPYFL